jgi:hypothetical protein
MGKAVSFIDIELGRRADRVFLARMNTQYDPSNTLDLNGYSNVQRLSQERNMLGQTAVSGRLINLIDYEQFNNLLTDDRSLAWTIQHPPSTSVSAIRYPLYQIGESNPITEECSGRNPDIHVFHGELPTFSREC